jgi:hypothetical protein
MLTLLGSTPNNAAMSATPSNFFTTTSHLLSS